MLRGRIKMSRAESARLCILAPCRESTAARPIRADGRKSSALKEASPGGNSSSAGYFSTVFSPAPMVLHDRKRRSSTGHAQHKRWSISYRWTAKWRTDRVEADYRGRRHRPAVKGGKTTWGAATAVTEEEGNGVVVSNDRDGRGMRLLRRWSVTGSGRQQP
ncbi:hypothetical protein B296_00026290 [Ensete ventricosum]|uniref:Uncharacterized protein n=1 Tax=Ensete ventricosum TaxID=4639 RepID=A0A426YNN8_ENSVE|nr:hypothetical protein B296_00026290 [Ensete ventricosum]